MRKSYKEMATSFLIPPAAWAPYTALLARMSGFSLPVSPEWTGVQTKLTGVALHKS